MIRGSFIVVGTLLSAGLAAAEPVVFVSPRGGETLQGGQVVEVRFDGVPDDVEEMELLLIAGPERTIAFRLTEMFDPATRSFSWTVPNLVLPQASLVLRMGEDDEREVESAPSSPFAIEPSPSRAAARLDDRHGELWVSDGGVEASAPYSLPGMSMTPTVEDSGRDDGPSKGLLRNHVHGDPADVDAGVAIPAAACAVPATASGPSLSRSPRDVPRRI